MTSEIVSISPWRGEIIATRKQPDKTELKKQLIAGKEAFNTWRNTDIAHRAKICNRFVDCLLDNKDAIAKTICEQVGRPISQCTGELEGLAERARYMINVAPEPLADKVVAIDDDFKRLIRPEPLGLIAVLAPWNYPFLTAVNSIIPAIMAGNTVILKHSPQTLLCAEQFAQAFDNAELPLSVFQIAHIDHEKTAWMIQQEEINFVSFTGSVSGGVAIETALAGKFKGLALELGGNDPAYVHFDAEIQSTAENLADGSFYNSGQSCCAIERIYVHQKIYQDFLNALVTCASNYQLGNPSDENVNLGPVISQNAAARIKSQIAEAITQGAKSLIPEACYDLSEMPETVLQPQVLVNTDANMTIMKEETFGPVVCVVAVESEIEALELMNDSNYGLTASVWTNHLELAETLGSQLEYGTVFMNRCDYLDPTLPWVGIKHSGRGISLSHLAYQQLTRPKSFHFKIKELVEGNE